MSVPRMILYGSPPFDLAWKSRISDTAHPVFGHSASRRALKRQTGQEEDQEQNVGAASILLDADKHEEWVLSETRNLSMAARRVSERTAHRRQFKSKEGGPAASDETNKSARIEARRNGSGTAKPESARITHGLELEVGS